MLPALGHCEDLQCQSKSSHEPVRLFRCSIHCDRNLCLFHLNAHNVYYEEEKKQSTIVINDLQSCLTLYQTIFEKQIASYRDLVRQASTILLHNTSSIVPVEQIQPVLEKIQQAIAFYQDERIVIKCEASVDETENINDGTNKNINVDSGQKVVVRIPRIECNKGNTQTENAENDENVFKPGNDSPEARSTPKKSETKRKTSSVKRLQK